MSNTFCVFQFLKVWWEMTTMKKFQGYQITIKYMCGVVDSMFVLLVLCTYIYAYWLFLNINQKTIFRIWNMIWSHYNLMSHLILMVYSRFMIVIFHASEGKFTIEGMKDKNVHYFVGNLIISSLNCLDYIRR